jgi:hypothetical protein
MRTFVVSAAAAAAFLATPASAVATLTYEAPGVQNSTQTLAVVGVERFDTRQRGSDRTFTTDFGTGGLIQATYRDVRIDGPNVYGSAGGVGNHAVTFQSDGGYEVVFTRAPREGLSYFGYWLSALDGQNRLAFYKGNTLIETITPGSIRADLRNCPTSAWCGNPTTPFQGQVRNEMFAFVNVFMPEGTTFDRIRFFQAGGGGYESDNHTVGFVDMPTVPEPTSWALLITGFGLVGFAARRRRREGTRASA